jgi:hypothetical protein
MDHTKEQWIQFIEVFNKKSFIDKLRIIKNKNDLLCIVQDNGWFWIEIKNISKESEEEIKESNWFQIDGKNYGGEPFTDSSAMNDLLSVAGLL